MKKFISIILVSVVVFAFKNANNPKFEPVTQVEITTKSIPTLEVETPKVEIKKPKLLVEAMIQVESGGIEDIIGDKHIVGGEAVGVLQIRPVMVREINRQLKRNGMEPRFTLNDRFSREKSIEMFNVYVALLHPTDSDEVIARNWNGGPRGYKKKSTLKYWAKVQKELLK